MTDHPVVTHEEWDQRKKFLEMKKEFSKLRDEATKLRPASAYSIRTPAGD